MTCDAEAPHRSELASFELENKVVFIFHLLILCFKMTLKESRQSTKHTSDVLVHFFKS